jgi:hypothetical protein
MDFLKRESGDSPSQEVIEWKGSRSIPSLTGDSEDDIQMEKKNVGTEPSVPPHQRFTSTNTRHKAYTHRHNH